MTLLEQEVPQSVREAEPRCDFGIAAGARTNDRAPVPVPGYCALCSVRDACRPSARATNDGAAVTQLASTNRMIGRGECLFRGGDEFRSLYIVRSGFFKTVQSVDGGREQVTGFFMAGDMLGFEGIHAGTHRCDAVALEDSNVCVIPYARLEQLGRNGSLVNPILRAMSGEIVQDHRIMMLLGLRSAEERIANFLIGLSQRLLARGYSPSEFNLRMTRRDIGSYLGLKFETVSRVFSRFREEGLIEVKLRHVRIQDLAGLRRVASLDLYPLPQSATALRPVNRAPAVAAAA